MAKIKIQNVPEVATISQLLGVDTSNKWAKIAGAKFATVEQVNAVDTKATEAKQAATNAQKAAAAAALSAQGAQNGLAGKAPIASPAFTGTPTAPTQAATDNSTKIATTAFVNEFRNAGYVRSSSQDSSSNKTWTKNEEMFWQAGNKSMNLIIANTDFLNSPLNYIRCFIIVSGLTSPFTLTVRNTSLGYAARHTFSGLIDGYYRITVESVRCPDTFDVPIESRAVIEPMQFINTI